MSPEHGLLYHKGNSKIGGEGSGDPAWDRAATGWPELEVVGDAQLGHADAEAGWAGPPL